MAESEAGRTSGEDDVRALLTRAVELRQAGRLDEAAALARRAAEAAPRHAGARHLLGVLALAQNRPAEAETELQRAVELSPGLVAAHVSLARARYEQGRAEPALVAYDAALALDPQHGEALGNRAMALAALARHEEALAGLAAALALRPDEPLLHLARGNSFTALGRFAEARDAYDRAAALDPRMAEAIWNRGLARLALGDFAAGWDDYEKRWAVPAFAEGSRGSVTPELARRFDPSMRRDDLPGRRVLVVAEQGVGDVIMFASVLPDLAAIAETVTLVCEPRLAPLIARSMPAIAVCGHAPDPMGFDAVVPLGSLPRLFRRAAKDFPGTPYLSPSDDARNWAAQWLGQPDGRLRIGVSWRGGLAQTRRSERSIDLTSLQPILDLPGCEFVSLQYGDVAAELAANGGLRAPSPADLADFDRLAALIRGLDLVVSVQTAVVHLAGAVGTPCLVMTPARPEWRYAAAGPRLPWYQSVEVVRQEPGEGWAPVIARVVGRIVALTPRG